MCAMSKSMRTDGTLWQEYLLVARVSWSSSIVKFLSGNECSIQASWKSKAQQAYEKANYLLEHGIETAPPVAYIVVRRMGFYHTSYFVSEYLPYIPGRRMWHLIKVRREHEKILTGYMNFKRLLTEKGIDITDADPNNTLVYKRGDEYHFAQIDINRIKIRGRYFCLK